jgi:hypothetical protein
MYKGKKKKKHQSAIEGRGDEFRHTLTICVQYKINAAIIAKYQTNLMHLALDILFVLFFNYLYISLF